MSRDLKKLIDAIDEKNQSQSELEKMVDFLKSEVDRLNFTINEQRLLIQDQENRVINNSDVPYEVEILKEMVINQRKELTKKDKDIDILNDLIYDLKTKIKNVEKRSKTDIEDEKLINLKKNIIQLTERNQQLQEERKNARKMIDELTLEDFKKDELITELTEGLENLENELYKTKGEKTTKSTEIQRDLELAYDTIERLKLQVESLQEQVIELNQALEQTKFQSNDAIQPNEIESMNCENCEKLNQSEEKLQVLINEAEDLEAQVVFLKEELAKSKQSEEIDSGDLIDDGELLEENTKLSRELKNAKMTIDRLITEIDGYVKEISEQNNIIRNKNVKIGALDKKIEIYKTQYEELQVKANNQLEISDPLEALDQKTQLDSEAISEIEKENKGLKEKLIQLEAQYSEACEKIKTDESIKEQSSEIIKSLREQLKEMNEKVKNLESPERTVVNVSHPSKIDEIRLADRLDNSLFMDMFRSLEPIKREQIKHVLFNALNNDNRDIKKYAMNILSKIKDADIFSKLEELTRAPDWIIKIYAIKALLKVSDGFEIRETLERLENDKDEDVRELATRSLKKLELNNRLNAQEEYRQDFSVNRWNWDESKGQWIFIEQKENGKKEIISQLEPPQAFIELSMELKTLNEQLMFTEEIDEKERLFEKMKDITRRMQQMGR